MTSVRLSSLVSPALALEWSHSFAAAVFFRWNQNFTVAAAVAFEVVGGFLIFPWRRGGSTTSGMIDPCIVSLSLI